MNGTSDSVVREESLEEKDARLRLALDIHMAVIEHAPAGWKGDEVRENQVKNALFPIMSRNRVATLAVFEIVKNQPGY
jgi:type I restriction enzyme R subunit